MTPLAKAALLSFLLALIKLSAYLATNSLVVLTSFFDSLADSVISLMNSRVERFSRQAPDREHPFGHGGFEVISSLAQGLVITVSGLILISQAGQQLLSRRDYLGGNEQLVYGIFTLLAAALGGALLSRLLINAEQSNEKAKRRSLSLAADKAHYLGDFFANLAGAAGLTLVYYTGWSTLDATFGVVGGCFLIKVALPIIRKSLRDILHHEIDPVFQKEIVEAVLKTDGRIKGVHRLRARGLGPTRFVDFHLKLPASLTLQEAHGIGEEVTRSLKRDIPHIDVIIHLDPDSEPDDDLWLPSYRANKN